MGLMDRLGRLTGKKSEPNAQLLADQSRQRTLHGQAMAQHPDEQARMRRQMEEELDTQREKNQPPS